jgi:predicted AlkP superfamily pyrophosphatase or phosphodiesterase
MLLMVFSSLLAQKSSKSITSKKEHLDRPRLVVGLVIDQMRWDFLHRYSSNYQAGGFKRLMREGFSCDNTMISHIPTYTAVGHAGIYTGTYPSIHGIVGNDWYDYQTGKNVYCTEDSAVHAVGGSASAGGMSPRKLLTTAITDELRLSSNFKSKIIGISLKDRGAILPAGQSANAAYWYDDSTGTMMSSDYYMKVLPDWVKQFNQQARPDSYMKDGWRTLLPAGDEENSTADDMPFEASMPGAKTHTFPYTFNLDSSNKYKVFKTTPMSMAYSFDFAKKTIEAVAMGKGKGTDFLALSISTTDYIGHTFGPNSLENEDAYLRLDQYLADFLLYLDNEIGQGNYLLFLTADHGAAHNPEFLQQHHIQAGVIKFKELMKTLNDSIEVKFKMKNAIGAFQNYQLYFSPEFMAQYTFSIPVVSAFITGYLEKQPGISRAFLLDKTQEAVLPDVIKIRVINSIHAKRSGHIQIIPESGYFSGSMKGTTHGTWNPYDAHIPLLWYGWNVRQGKTNEEVNMIDIAPTLAALLNIQMPSGSVGRVVEKLTQ